MLANVSPGAFLQAFMVGEAGMRIVDMTGSVAYSPCCLVLTISQPACLTTSVCVLLFLSYRSQAEQATVAVEKGDCDGEFRFRSVC